MLDEHITQELIITFPTSVLNIFFRNFFFTTAVIESNNLDLKKGNSETFSAFKENVLKFIRPSSSSIFHCHSPNAIKLITRMYLSLSHLREHKFRYNFQDTPNPICSCGMTSRLLLTTYFIVQII